MLPTLLVLASGLFLVQRTLAQAGFTTICETEKQILQLEVISMDQRDPYKPSLSAWPSRIVTQGNNVTLHCDSHLGPGEFRLYKEGGAPIPELQNRIFQENILLGPVTTAHAGTYRCYESNLHSPDEVSAHSDPLVIIISGVYRKPSLLALPTPLVKSRGNVNLLCSSEIMFEVFFLVLHRDGVINEPLFLVGESHYAVSQGNLSIGPMTPAQAGTYRCFGSFRQHPYEWSDASDPVDIEIRDDPRHLRHLHVLIGLSVTIILLVFLLIFLIHHWCFAKKNAAVIDQEADMERTVNIQLSEEETQEVTYTELNPQVITQKTVTPTFPRPKESCSVTSVYLEFMKS